MSLNARPAAGPTRSTALARQSAWLIWGAAAVVLGWAVAALPLELATGLALGLIVVTGTLLDPLVGLAALIAAVPVSTIVTVETGDFSVTAIEPLMALLVAAWLARGISQRDIRIDGGALMAPLALLLLALLISSLSAQKLGLAFKELVKWLELAIVFLFTVAHARSETRQRFVLAVLFLAGTAEAVYGVYQYAAGAGPAAFAIGEALRAYGHFEQPNPFAGYLATILPLSAALALTGRPPAFARLAALAAAATGLGVLLSLSRGAWVGLLLALVGMLAAWGPVGRRLLLPGAASVALLVLLTATNIVPGGWSDRLVAIVENFGIFDVRTVEVNTENFAVVERMAHWQAAWAMFLDHPFLGVGPGNYAAAYDDYSLPGWREALGHAHNYYLNTAAETGLPGLGALLFLLSQVFRTILAGLHRAAPMTYHRGLLAGLLGSFVVLTVHNLFDNLLVHGMQVQVGMLLGLAVLAASPESLAQSSKELANRPSR